MSVERHISPAHVTGPARVTRPVRVHQRVVLRLLRLLSANDSSVRIHRGEDEIEVPGEVRDLFVDALESLAHGSEVAVVEVGESPADEELTTQEAADILNVSRPHVVKLCRTGQLPHHKVGNRHRLYRSDVETYRQERDRDRDDALARIAEYGPDEF